MTFRSRKLGRSNAGTLQVTLLQWGRDLSVTETRIEAGSGLSQHELQWGRDLSVTETGVSALGGAESVMLQWGRDLSVTETSLLDCGDWSGTLASMGP